MHPLIEHPTLQEHFGDLRREADERRRHRLLRTQRRRQRRGDPVATLSPSVHRVLVFAEHDPSPMQLDDLLHHLSGLRDDTVMTLVHQQTSPSLSGGREAGSRETPAITPTARIPAQRGHADADRGLVHLMDALHSAGHRATGEVTSGSPSQVLVNAVNKRHPEAVILLTGQHRLAHFAHRDLEHRVLARTDAPVLTLTGAGKN